MERLFVQPEDTPEMIDAILKNWESFKSTTLAKLCQTYVENQGIISWIHIDAYQHQDSVIQDVLKQLSLHGFDESTNAHLPYMLDPDDGLEANMDFVRLRNFNLKPNEPARNLGIWGMYDCVAFKNQSILENGSSKFVVVYKVCI